MNVPESSALQSQINPHHHHHHQFPHFSPHMYYSPQIQQEINSSLTPHVYAHQEEQANQYPDSVRQYQPQYYTSTAVPQVYQPPGTYYSSSLCSTVYVRTHNCHACHSYAHGNVYIQLSIALGQGNPQLVYSASEVNFITTV